MFILDPFLLIRDTAQSDVKSQSYFDQSLI